MYNCWLSPEGEVIPCNIHEDEAWKIIKERYGVSPTRRIDSSIFLGERNWMAYHVRIWSVGWWKYLYSKAPTQAQVDKIYELTGDVFELGDDL
jgi:hypothetical protein